MDREKIMSAFLLIAILLVSVHDLQADPFKKGSRRESIVVGSGRTFANDYIIVGLGAG
jgi:hypothetical protein